MAAPATKHTTARQGENVPRREVVLRQLEILREIKAPKEVIEVAERVAASLPPDRESNSPQR
jgi:hypothetical protein